MAEQERRKRTRTQTNHQTQHHKEASSVLLRPLASLSGDIEQAGDEVPIGDRQNNKVDHSHVPLPPERISLKSKSIKYTKSYPGQAVNVNKTTILVRVMLVNPLSDQVPDVVD